jgi:transposase
MEQPQCPGCRERDARIAALEAQVAELRGQVNDLAKSLTPPRAAATLPKAPPKKPSGRKPGGQPGHPPHLKRILPSERINRIVTYLPDRCAHCDTPLSKEPGPEDPQPMLHQVAELPALAAEITEHQGHARTCLCCGWLTWAKIPDEVRAHSVGPRLTAVLSYFAGSHGVSKRGVEEISEAVFEAPIALGTVANLEQEISAALAPAHREGTSRRPSCRYLRR